jgi:hypothetical protein
LDLPWAQVVLEAEMKNYLCRMILLPKRKGEDEGGGECGIPDPPTVGVRMRSGSVGFKRRPLFIDKANA